MATFDEIRTLEATNGFPWCLDATLDSDAAAAVVAGDVPNIYSQEEAMRVFWLLKSLTVTFPTGTASATAEGTHEAAGTSGPVNASISIPAGSHTLQMQINNGSGLFTPTAPSEKICSATNSGGQALRDSYSDTDTTEGEDVATDLVTRTADVRVTYAVAMTAGNMAVYRLKNGAGAVLGYHVSLGLTIAFTLTARARYRAGGTLLSQLIGSQTKRLASRNAVVNYLGPTEQLVVSLGAGVNYEFDVTDDEDDISDAATPSGTDLAGAWSADLSISTSLEMPTLEAQMWAKA